MNYIKISRIMTVIASLVIVLLLLISNITFLFSLNMQTIDINNNHKAMTIIAISILPVIICSIIVIINNIRIILEYFRKTRIINWRKTVYTINIMLLLFLIVVTIKSTGYDLFNAVDISVFILILIFVNHMILEKIYGIPLIKK